MSFALSPVTVPAEPPGDHRPGDHRPQGSSSSVRRSPGSCGWWRTNKRQQVTTILTCLSRVIEHRARRAEKTTLCPWDRRRALQLMWVRKKMLTIVQ